MGLSKSMRVLVMTVVTQCHATISVAEDVGRSVGIKGKTCTSLSSQIKKAYETIIFPYEEYLSSKDKENPKKRRGRKKNNEGLEVF